MTQRRLFVFVNGILTFPGASSNWTGRAVTRTHLDTPHAAEKVEYLTLPTLHRLLGQRNRVVKLARTISFYEGWQLVLAAHSNGAGVVLEALRYLEWPRVEQVHLFSPACNADCRATGLRRAQDFGKLGLLRCYIAGKDAAVRMAATSLGQLFGYGAMGVYGPLHGCQETTEVVSMHQWGHSDWWTDSNFPWTMRQILGTQQNQAAKKGPT